MGGFTREYAVHLKYKSKQKHKKTTTKNERKEMNDIILLPSKSTLVVRLVDV